MSRKEIPEWAELKWGHILDAAGFYGTWRNRGSYLLETADKYGPDSPEFAGIYGRYSADDIIVKALMGVGNVQEA